MFYYACNHVSNGVKLHQLCQGFVAESSMAWR